MIPIEYSAAAQLDNHQPALGPPRGRRRPRLRLPVGLRPSATTDPAAMAVDSGGRLSHNQLPLLPPTAAASSAVGRVRPLPMSHSREPMPTKTIIHSYLITSWLFSAPTRCTAAFASSPAPVAERRIGCRLWPPRPRSNRQRRICAAR
jgi:hypothetical protein